MPGNLRGPNPHGLPPKEGGRPGRTSLAIVDPSALTAIMVRARQFLKEPQADARPTEVTPALQAVPTPPPATKEPTGLGCLVIVARHHGMHLMVPQPNSVTMY